MARLRQIHSNDYVASGKVHDEFENLIRYINAAETAHGNKTFAELMDVLFNDSGEFDGPIQFRFDSTDGLEYRVGEYTDPDAGWKQVAEAAKLRGAPGKDVGTITGPILYNRQDYVATASQTVFNYDLDSSAETAVVYVNGLLQEESAYTISTANNTITFSTGLNVSDNVTIYSIRESAATPFRRETTTSTAGQAVFAFVHQPDDEFFVYVNGILQRPGGSYDYTSDANRDTITFTFGLSANDVVEILAFHNSSLRDVGGLMLEDKFLDDAGLIDWPLIGVDNNEIPQSKVNNLTTDLSTKAKLTVSGTTPSSPANGDMWLDTSSSPALLKYYDTSTAAWLNTSPESTLPNFATTDANKYVAVNGTGTALEYKVFDTSGLVKTNQKGAANGVAELDANARLVTTQLPQSISTGTFYGEVGGTVSSGNYSIQRIFKEKVRIDGIVVLTQAGTCDVTIQVNGVDQGSSHAASTSLNETTLGTTIEVDATASSRKIGFKVANATSCADLEVALAYTVLTS